MGLKSSCVAPEIGRVFLDLMQATKNDGVIFWGEGRWGVSEAPLVLLINIYLHIYNSYPSFFSKY